LVEKGIRRGNLGFTGDLKEGAEGAEAVFIAVGTPSGPGGRADLTDFWKVASDLAQLPPATRIAVIKSTVPVGTGDALEEYLRKKAPHAHWQVVSNPEFLRQGLALEDFLKGDRIVIGAKEEEAAQRVAQLYAPLSRPLLIVDRRTAEMIKYASNAFLATKISFINEMARLCQEVGADIEKVAQGMGLDHRIGPHFLRAGIGFGGSCLPKDLLSLISLGRDLGKNLPLLRAVWDINEEQKLLLAGYLEEIWGELQGKKVAVLGITFKPGTDDTRDAPSLGLIPHLILRGALVTAYDPQEKARRVLAQLFPQCMVYDNPYQAAAAAHALLFLTEWPEFSSLDWKRLQLLTQGSVVLDGRNFLSPEAMEGQGFILRGHRPRGI